MYVNLQANLLPPLGDDEPYSRPLHRIKHDLPKPKCLKRFKLRTVVPWMGRGATRSMLHHDRHDTLYVLLRGRKRFRVFPPSDALKLMPVHPPLKIRPSGEIEYATAVDHEHLLTQGEFSHFVRTDLGAASPFPAKAEDLRASGLEVELRPGQAFFLPGHWFHEVESIGEGDSGPHIAVGFDVERPDDLDQRTLKVRRQAQAAKRRRRRKRAREL
uniref:JmjC domain-containing protein n=1 Tax=Alexandrium catenella TaxID=2925 RepID=A0A7S1QI24_ALECA|mmetsp:Transcript_31796/g.86178  ORF Transcript_31796/g.86178 Transcript_31796/m.86178 type:complete len:215 (+) Transcript_31796:3-647(+)